MDNPNTAPATIPDNRISLEILGFFHGFTGYAVHARAIAHHLLEEGFTLKIIPYNNTHPIPDPSLDLCRKTKLDSTYPIIRLVCLPPHPYYHQNRYTILLTMMETHSLHPGVISRLRTANEVWTPNLYNFMQFRNALPKRIPVFFMPEGTDISIYNDKTPPLDIRNSSTFVAVSVFAWQWRKGPDVLIKAWLKAFTSKDNARLILLTRVPTLSKRESRTLIQQEIAKISTEINNPDPAPIIVADDPLPDEAMPGFYRAADCFVLPTRGEGWCQPALDAMACGTPVIITGSSGQLTFCNKHNSLLLPPGKPTAFVPEKVRLMDFFNNQTFDNPSPDDCAAALRNLYKYPTLRADLASQALFDVRQKWQWQITLKRISKRLKEIDSLLKEKPHAATSSLENHCP